MKSVRMAPLILLFSTVHRSTAGSASALDSVSCSAACSAALRMNLCASFSKPSKHRNAPPSINSGVTAQGTKALMTSAAGTKIALLMNEPLATAQTTGNSRSAFTPETCWALSARSSPSTPAVFLAATLDSKATSSSRVEMSSINASRLVAMVFQKVLSDDLRRENERVSHAENRQSWRKLRATRQGWPFAPCPARGAGASL